jgi:asparaginyl-tRNA synthetase
MYVRADDIKSIDYIGKQVTIRGWVYRLRKQKENTFVLIRDDRGGIIQSIFPTEKVTNLTIESSIEINGVVRQDNRAPEGGFEIKGNNLEIFHIAEPDYPIGEYQSSELLLDYRHLSLRMRRMIAIAKIRVSILKYARQWFIENDWMEITPPIVVKGAVEGGSTLFKIKYFDEEAYLSQSAQLYLEAMIFCLGRVWCLTPSFRAEKSRTIRHLAEFSHLEAEAPWVNLEDILDIQEQLISYIVEKTVAERTKEFALLKRDVGQLKKVKVPFDRIQYEEAIEILRSKGFSIKEENGKKRFIIGYPIQVKPFYVKEDPKNEGIGLAADMLAPSGFGEIISGGLREEDITSITKRIEKEGLNPHAYRWYLELRKYGSVPHGGFGLGIERLMRWIINTEDIKDTALFPRTMSRATP